MFTIDTEISLGGALEDLSNAPVGARRRIWCETDEGRYGIEAFMDVFDEYDMKGVFFFEPFGVNLVDPEPLKAAARYIAERGHDVELHIHPEFDINLERARKQSQPPSPFVRDYSLEHQRGLIRRGADLLEAWTGRRPIAFRAGSFGLDEVGLKACLEEGLLFDSSYNAWAIQNGYCGMHSLPRLNDVTLLEDGLVEVPVTNLFARRIRRDYRPFDLASLNTTEMVSALDQLHEAGARVCCSLTHSFRLLKTTNVQMSDARPDQFNLHRLRALCRYLAENSDRYQVSTFKDLPTDMWRLQKPSTQAFYPAPPTWSSLARVALQAVKDRGAI